MATKAQLEKELKKTQTMLNAALDKLKDVNTPKEKLNEVTYTVEKIDMAQPKAKTFQQLFVEIEGLSNVLENEINTIFPRLSMITGGVYGSLREEQKERNCYIVAMQDVIQRLDEQVADVVKIRGVLEELTN